MRRMYCKRFGKYVLPFLLSCLLLSACGNKDEGAVAEKTSAEGMVETTDTMFESSDADGNHREAEDASGSAVSGQVKDEVQEGTEEMSKLIIEVNGHRLVATLADNSSAGALKELLAEGPVTINMHDFSNFEKVGELPQELPRNDEQTDTDYGDLILYLGKRFVIYYDKNSWNFTRLGHIDDITQDELKRILGDGDVTAVLSMGEDA